MTRMRFNSDNIMKPYPAAEALCQAAVTVSQG